MGNHNHIDFCEVDSIWRGASSAGQNTFESEEAF